MTKHHEPGTPTNREKELAAFKERQLRELKEFEERQKQELEQFARREEEELKELEQRQHPYEIKIDRTQFKVTEQFLTGAQLRALPSPPIGPDRDLFEVVPGGSDEKIADTQKVKMRDGLRFFTAPAQINPGLA
ncbi:multiubiquitin domain-containing protein [Bradyrhizobium sp. LMG 9283]|uniref:multiubiquitin domain-containing protein n=1 Tax=Bradyrhizobium sp. LMG 9283 TaxID=592064 RepID=UPI00388E9405